MVYLCGLSGGDEFHAVLVGTPTPAQPQGAGTQDQRDRIRQRQDGHWQGRHPGYTAQAAVDSANQIIVAAYIIGSGSEQSMLLPMIGQAAPYRAQTLTVGTAPRAHHMLITLPLTGRSIRAPAAAAERRRTRASPVCQELANGTQPRLNCEAIDLGTRPLFHLGITAWYLSLPVERQAC